MLFSKSTATGRPVVEVEMLLGSDAPATRTAVRCDLLPLQSGLVA